MTGFGSSLFQQFGANTAVGSLLEDNPGLAIDFTTAQCIIRDPNTPSNNFLGSLTQAVAASKITVVRSGTAATYMDSGGVIRKAAANTLRIDYDRKTGTCLGLLAEEARTAQNGAPCDLSNVTYWGANSFAATTDKISLIEGEIAKSFQGDGVTSSLNRTANFTSTAGFNYAFFAIIEEEDALEFAIGFYDVTATTFMGLAKYTWATGLITTQSGTLVSSKVTDLGFGPNGGRLRKIEAVALNGANTSGRLYVYPNGTLAPSTKTIIHCAQIERGAVSSSLIYTAGAGGTSRPTDMIDIPITAIGFDTSVGTVAARSRNFGLGAGLVGGPWAFYPTGSDTNLIRQYFYNPTPYRAGSNCIATSVSQWDMNATVTPDTFSNVVIGWQTNSAALSINGGAAITDAAATIPTGMTHMAVGRGNRTSHHINGHVSHLVYWPARKINSEVVRLSSYTFNLDLITPYVVRTKIEQNVGSTTDFQTLAISEPAIGNRLILAVFPEKVSGAFNLPTDNGIGVWTQVGVTFPGTNGISGALFTKISDGTENTITASWATPQNSIMIYAEIANAGDIDQFGISTTYTEDTGRSSGVITTAGPIANVPQLALSFMATDSAASTSSATAHGWSNDFIEIVEMGMGSTNYNESSTRPSGSMGRKVLREISTPSTEFTWMDDTVDEAIGFLITIAAA